MRIQQHVNALLSAMLLLTMVEIKPHLIKAISLLYALNAHDTVYFHVNSRCINSKQNEEIRLNFYKAFQLCQIEIN